MIPTRRFPPQPITVLASDARTADATSVHHDGVPSTYDGVLVVVDVTDASGTLSPTLTVNLQDDDGSGFTTRLSTAAIEAAGTHLLLAHPEAPDRANVSITQLNYKWRVTGVLGGTAPSFTYSVLAYALA